jgi:hypothetical protein
MAAEPRFLGHGAHVMHKSHRHIDPEQHPMRHSRWHNLVGYDHGLIYVTAETDSAGPRPRPAPFRV